MKRAIKRPAKLSQGELRLMGLLWERGPLTLAEAFQAQPGQLGYTTIQTQLNRLVGKGVVSRSRTRPMKYRALIEPRAAGERMLQLLVDSVGGGSVVPLIAQLLSHVSLSADDARELKRLIDKAMTKSGQRKRR